MPQTPAEMFRVLTYAYANSKIVQFTPHDDSPCWDDDAAPESPTGVPRPYREDLSTWTMDDLDWDYLLAPPSERDPSGRAPGTTILESVHPLGWSVPADYVAPPLPDCYGGRPTPDRANAITVTRTVTICAEGESVTLHPADGIALVTDRDGNRIAIVLELLRAAALEIANI